MAFAITQNCCTDASCLSVCPVNCIHPTPDEPEFGHTELLHIDPRACIDCGACADACPVEAITPVSVLTPSQAGYAEINASYYQSRPVAAEWAPPRFPTAGLRGVGRLQIAIIGTGPAACYAAQELLRITDARLTFYDRMQVPGGLARFGVAPDHLATRQVAVRFRQLFDHPRVSMRLGVEVGANPTHAQLRRRFDAVVYGIGASSDRQLGVSGEELPGVLSARTLVGWYNGRPDVPASAVDLTEVERVVIVGNGNVALDAARILTADPISLENTAISGHALAALRSSAVREVVIVGRRGPEHAAFTRGEAMALRSVPGLELLVRQGLGVAEAIDGAPLTAPAAALQGLAQLELDWSELPSSGRRIVFGFGSTVTAFTGADRLDTVALADRDGSATPIPTRLALRAIGYRGEPQPGLPYNATTGAIPNVDGRVMADGVPLPGTYVVGWAKRGPLGGIGANKSCAEETVAALVEDAVAGRFGQRPGRLGQFARTR